MTIQSARVHVSLVQYPSVSGVSAGMDASPSTTISITNTTVHLHSSSPNVAPALVFDNPNPSNSGSSLETSNASVIAVPVAFITDVDAAALREDGFMLLCMEAPVAGDSPTHGPTTVHSEVHMYFDTVDASVIAIANDVGRLVERQKRVRVARGKGNKGAGEFMAAGREARGDVDVWPTAKAVAMLEELRKGRKSAIGRVVTRGLYDKQAAEQEREAVGDSTSTEVIADTGDHQQHQHRLPVLSYGSNAQPTGASSMDTGSHSASSSDSTQGGGLGSSGLVDNRSDCNDPGGTGIVESASNQPQYGGSTTFDAHVREENDEDDDALSL